MDTASAVALLETVFSPVDGYAISRGAREGGDAEEHSQKEALTYGEIDLPSFAELLSSESVALEAGASFVDVGGGTAKAALLAACMGATTALSIELVSALHAAGEGALARLARAEPALAARCELRRNDMTLEGWETTPGEHLIVFAPCSCFSDELMASLYAKCLLLPAGTLVITTTRKLEEAASHSAAAAYDGSKRPRKRRKKPRIPFRLRSSERYKYGRGALTFFVYEAKGPAASSAGA